MKEGITKEEADILDKIDAIKIDREYRKILNDVDKYFQPYIDKIKTPIANIFIRSSILLILRKLDTADDLCNKAADYFLEKCSVEEWFDKLIDFYTYAMSCNDYILLNHDNSILDCYNKKQINKKTMMHTMKTFVATKKIMIKNKEMLEECIANIRKEKELYGDSWE